MHRDSRARDSLSWSLLAASDLNAMRASICEFGRTALGVNDLQVLIDQPLPGSDVDQLERELLTDRSGKALGSLTWTATESDPRCLGDWPRLVTAIGNALGGLLENQTLRSAVNRVEAAERLQSALFAIADMASADLEMPEMLRGLHQIVGGLMYAENFIIVLYDDERQTVRFIYFADTVDRVVFDPNQEFPAAEMENSLTLAIIRRGRAELGPSNEVRDRLGVPRDEGRMGPASEDWLGVPMVGSDRVCGAIVVQSYDSTRRFSIEDQTLLSYVAQHILTALERKQSREELEQRVRERTRELAQANSDLRLEIAERQRSEKLQGALFKIAELSSTTETLADFYSAVHEIVGELLYARNFYIALLSDDGTELMFPYSVDEMDVRLSRRRLAKGLSEYVLRTGRALLADRSIISELAQAGEVASFGARSVCWLGVPLACDERTVGVLAVQSYSAEITFDCRDQDLLTFVGFHIAVGLERKRAQDSLRSAYSELRASHASLESAHSQLVVTQQQLVQQEKMAALGTLTAGVAHEINNPTNFADGAVQQLVSQHVQLHQFLRELAGADAPPRVLEAIATRFDALKEMTATAREGHERIKRIVADLRQFTRLDEAERKSIAIADPIQSTVNLVRTRFDRIRFDLDLSFNPSIECQPAKLSQVFMNLIVNACEAIGECRDGRKGVVRIATASAERSIEIVVADNGAGIDEVTLGHVFEPFFTTKEVGAGTGLGLAIVFGIVKDHGGRVEVQSTPGEGTRFVLHLPRGEHA